MGGGSPTLVAEPMHFPLVIALLIQLLPVQFVCIQGQVERARTVIAVAEQSPCGSCPSACTQCRSCPRSDQRDQRQVPAPVKIRSLGDAIPALLVPPSHPSVAEASRPVIAASASKGVHAGVTNTQRQSLLGVWLN